MDHQNKPPVSYPPPSTVYPAATGGGGAYEVPPPMGYPMKDVPANSQNDPSPGKTRASWDGFCKGCCAAVRCCCILDCVLNACF